MDYNAFADALAQLGASPEPEDCLLPALQLPGCQAAAAHAGATAAALKRELSHVLRRDDVDLVVPGAVRTGAGAASLALSHVARAAGGGPAGARGHARAHSIPTHPHLQPQHTPQAHTSTHSAHMHSMGCARAPLTRVCVCL
jgi:hypothetical protein